MNEAVRNPAEPIIEIENLSISFFTRKGEIPAVMDFSCQVMPGEAMGIVGESGCGKSTVSLGIMRDLSNIGKIVGGKIVFKGKDMGELTEDELRSIRGNEIAMIYQEPMASLNPAMKIGQQLMEVPMLHDKVSREEAYKRALETVRAVKLPDPERMMRSYPHQLSGGQQQRIVIAMSLLSKPALPSFHRRPVQCRRNPHDPGAGAPGPYEPLRPFPGTRLDRGAGRGEAERADRARQAGAEDRRSEEILSGGGERDFRRQRHACGQGQRIDQLRGA
jgi:ABC-type polar amino acid transport system ATPase subunit